MIMQELNLFLWIMEKTVEKSDFVEGVSAALNRAAEKVAEKARKENRAIPIWKNNRVVYEVPKKGS